jgi:very-short-patch-repair endonuclease
MSDVDDRVRELAALDRPRDQLLAMLADRQHGVAARWQLLALGFSRNAIQDRLNAGRLHRLYRGVHSVGYTRLTPRGRWMAAVLAGGQAAVLSHRAAVALWELRPSPSGPIDVTVPGRSRRGHDGIRVHNVRVLHPADRATLDGIPVTAVHRTLLDYAEIARPQQLRHALEAAERRELFDGRALEAMYARSRGRHGIRPLKAAINELIGPAPWTQSELERRFLALIREAGIEEPQANVIVAGELVDFYWPRHLLVVEVDGFEWHKTRRSFEDDRRRDGKLQLAGCRVLRVTETRMRQPRALIRDVLLMLSAAA